MKYKIEKTRCKRNFFLTKQFKKRAQAVQIKAMKICSVLTKNYALKTKLRDVTFVCLSAPIDVTKLDVLEDYPGRYGDVINGRPPRETKNQNEAERCNLYVQPSEFTNTHFYNIFCLIFRSLKKCKEHRIQQKEHETCETPRMEKKVLPIIGSNTFFANFQYLIAKKN